MKKLYRDEYNGVIGGVCAGMSQYFEIDPVLLRIIFLLFIFTPVPAILIYIIFWIITPNKL